MVKWSRQARRDLKEIREFIARDSPFYAARTVKMIVDKSVLLDRLPLAGRVVPERGREDIREFFVFLYRVIYRVEGFGISILGVLHGKRQFTEHTIRRL